MVWRPYALSTGLPCVDIPDSIDVLDTIDPRSFIDTLGCNDLDFTHVLGDRALSVPRVLGVDGRTGRTRERTGRARADPHGRTTRPFGCP